VTERDKMLRGELYDARDPALVAARLAARRLTRQLDLLDPGDVTDRDRLLRELLGDIGAGS